MKINELTPEQEKLMYQVKEEWLNRFFSCSNVINKPTTTELIKWLYKFSGLKEPEVIFVDSPLACQIAYNLLKQSGGKRLTQVRDQVWDQVSTQVRDQVSTQVRDQVRDQVSTQVRDQVWDQVSDQVWDRKTEFAQFSYYGSISDYGWVAFCDFFIRIGIINHDEFNHFNDLVKSGVFEMIQLDGLCIVCGLPTKITRDDRNRLHNESSSAIEWSDGYGQYYWHGVPVSSKLILIPNDITKEDISKEKNAEVRRAIQEKLGNERFSELLGIEAIDVDFLNNQEYVLYKTQTKDDQVGDYLYWIKVKCHSTGREYFLSVPPMSKVIDALAWTFEMTGEEYLPIIET